MSLLPNVTYANRSQPVFLLANISSLNVNSISTNYIQVATENVSSLYANFISTADCELSSIFATVLDLDGQVITANPTELLLNGIPIATTANISTLADWAIDPAISSINANNNDILNAAIGYFQTISTTNVRATNILADNILAKNIFSLSTYTSTISSLTEVADAGYFSTISSGQAYIGNLSSISINTSNINTSTLNAGIAQVSTILGNSGYYSTLFVSSINGNEFTQSSITTSSITVNVLGVSSLVATSISSIGAEIRQALMSSIVFSPSLNPSLGGVNVNLGLGSLLGNVVGWGAGVFGAVAGTVGLITGAVALTQGRAGGNITNNYELVNGTSQLQISTLGQSFSTIYRFNNSSDPASVPGQEIFVSTIYPPGLAIRTLSDPLYTLSTPQSTIQAQGQWVSLGDTLDASDWAQFPAVSTIQGANQDLIQVRNADISTISTAIIYGANTDLFGVFGVSGLKIEAPNVFLSTPQVVHPGFFNGSTIGANLVQAPIISTNSILCSTGSVLTNGLSAQIVDTQQLALNQAILSTSTAAGSAGQPAGRLVLGGNDFDLGQNDLWCQQVRVGAGNPSGSAQTEVILYSPDALTTRGLGIGSQDRTLRVISTINSGGGGYLLDTNINPPTFSTISTTTNLGSFFPSTSLSTIGWQTITTQPQYYCSAYNSTTQAVIAADTITPLAYNATALNLGGFTVSGSTITVSVPGIYEITTSIQLDTTSGGTNLVDFWFKKNGTDISDSASVVSVTGNGETLGTISILDVAQANDQYAVIFASEDANMTAVSRPALTTPYVRPRAPSIITNIKRLI